MNKSTKPQLSFDLGANDLHGVLRADQIRTDTLVQLVQHWASDEQSRDDAIDALDELAAMVSSVAREGELDAAIEQVEDVAGMDTAHTEVGMHDLLRLRAELDRVIAATAGRFNPGRSRIAAPRPVPGQQSAGAA